jgi:RNA polymerase sigma-70 factor (ECF subfamily)
MDDQSDEKREWYRKTVTSMQGPLLRYTRKIVGCLDTSKDVVQDTFIKLWSEPYPPITKYAKAWLYRVCRNRAIDYKRMGAGMESISEDMELTTDSYPEKEVERMEVFTMISRLSPKHKEVILLKFQEGLSYKEISDVTGHSVSHVGLLIHEGMQELREVFGKKEDDNE